MSQLPQPHRQLEVPAPEPLPLPPPAPSDRPRPGPPPRMIRDGFSAGRTLSGLQPEPQNDGPRRMRVLLLALLSAVALVVLLLLLLLPRRQETPPVTEWRTPNAADTQTLERLQEKYKKFAPAKENP